MQLKVVSSWRARHGHLQSSGTSVRLRGARTRHQPEIIELHHDKHHAAYVKGANDTLEQLAEARDKDQWGSINGLEKNLAFHLSGHILHSIYWHNMTGDGGGEPLDKDGVGELADAIAENFARSPSSRPS